MPSVDNFSDASERNEESDDDVENVQDDESDIDYEVVEDVDVDSDYVCVMFCIILCITY